MAEVDHFKVLGLLETATSDDIKKAYFKLAKIHHPDASNGDTVDRFRLICSSYEVLKNEQHRADYLLQKNGHSWEKKGTSQYNNVQSDFQRAHRVANKQSVKDINNFMNSFERFIHPKNLFVIIPAGLLTYWMMTSYVPSFFKKESKIDDGSVAGNIKAARKMTETVDAWRNPKTDRWESPAPWDPNYKAYIANTPLEKIDRHKVTQARPGGK